MVGDEIRIRVGQVELGAELNVPERAGGLVLFAHGSGSSRHSPRNQYVARVLREAAIGTLLFDLMTSKEEEAEAYTRHLRFDIPFLAKRLVAATEWAKTETAGQGRKLKLGYFGSSTGAAAALVAAAELGENVSSVVSRGGRPDLAGDALSKVTAPTLLVVGGDDEPVISLNEKAHGILKCEKAIRIIPGASHLFEESGTLEQVAEIAADWFAQHLR
jgi:pimeloyl-ACP methyl ester carboxylesterase